MELDYDWLLEAYNLRIEECMYKWKRIEELEEENKKLKEELKKTNELLSNVARCSEQYRGKMISVMEELKMFLYKD